MQTAKNLPGKPADREQTIFVSTKQRADGTPSDFSIIVPSGLIEADKDETGNKISVVPVSRLAPGSAAAIHKAKRHAVRKKERRQEHKAATDKASLAATRIQKIFRGHRARKEAKLREKVAAEVECYGDFLVPDRAKRPSDIQVAGKWYEILQIPVVCCPRRLIPDVDKLIPLKEYEHNDELMEADLEWKVFTTHVIYRYVDFIKFINLSVVPSTQAFKPRRVRNRDAEVFNLVAHRSITYEVDPEAATFDAVFRQPKLHAYLEQHYTPHRCLDTAILDAYKDAIEKAVGKGRFPQWRDRLTYDGLEDGEDGRSLDEAVDLWFRPMRLGLRVFDREGRISYGYHPAEDGNKLNDKLSPRQLNLLQLSDHVWTLNDGHNSIKFKNELEEETKKHKSRALELRAPEHYFLPDPKKKLKLVRRLITRVDEIVPYIQMLDKQCKEEAEAALATTECQAESSSAAETSAERVQLYWHETDLNGLLTTLVFDYKYLPKVSTQACRVVKLSIKVGSHTNPKYVDVMTYNCCNSNRRLPEFRDEAEFQSYVAALDRWEDTLLSSNRLDHYGAGVWETFRDHPRTPMTQRLGADGPDQAMWRADLSKHYVSEAMLMPKVPVLGCQPL
ncbi:hypothetical protein WJX72_003828 [[Myrmecia] bisecta]|uniref:Uncharacterized protein n=1 Tax=[Myrmecia] bisecta TaxID=41462 RepID=A0AAW1Q700_9CHLO